MSYVTLKVKTALRLGFKEVQENRPADIPEAELLELIDRYNRDVSIHGILVQLPLLPHISEERVINAIDPEKGRSRLSSGQSWEGGAWRRERLFTLYACGYPQNDRPLGDGYARSGDCGGGALKHRRGKPIALMMGQRGVDGP